MYDRSDSLHCCMQALTSSIDAGRLYVELKLLVNCLVSSSLYEGSFQVQGKENDEMR
jgi:hypothetical protein